MKSDDLRPPDVFDARVSAQELQDLEAGFNNDAETAPITGVEPDDGPGLVAQGSLLDQPNAVRRTATKLSRSKTFQAQRQAPIAKVTDMLRKIFEEYDSDGDKTLNVQEFRALVRACCAESGKGGPVGMQHMKRSDITQVFRRFKGEDELEGQTESTITFAQFQVCALI